MVKIKTHNLLAKYGCISDEQFKVLYFIYNTIAMNADDSGYAKIYRAVLADLTGKSERTISRITDKLAEQGLIIKHNVSDGNKLYNYYCIPRQETTQNSVTGDTKQDQFLVTGDRVKEGKNLKIEREKEVKTERTERDENLEEELCKKAVQEKETDADKAMKYINEELEAVQDFTQLSSTGTLLRSYVRNDCEIPGLEEYLNNAIKETVSSIRTSNG